MRVLRFMPSIRLRRFLRGWRFMLSMGMVGVLLALVMRFLAGIRLVTAFAVYNASVLVADTQSQTGSLIGWNDWNTPGRWNRVQQNHALLLLTNGADLLPLVLLIAALLWIWWHRRPYRPTTAYGSARWPTRWELLRLWDVPRPPHPAHVVLATIALCAPRMRGGHRRRRRAWIVQLERRMRRWQAAQRPPPSTFPVGFSHGMRLRLPIHWVYDMLLLIGVSGVGKTLRVLMAALLAQYGRMSWVILDPKSEFKDALQTTMEARMETWVVDPRDPTARHFNPLQHITSTVGAQKLAQIFVAHAGGKPPWDLYAAQVITLLVLHLRATEPAAPFSRLVDAASTITYSQMKGVISRSPDPQVQKLGKAWLERMTNNPTLCDSVLSNVARAFQNYDIPLVAEWTAHDELPLPELAQRPIGVILAIADSDQDAMQPIVIHLFDVLFDTLMEEARRQPGRRLKHGCIVYLDEFGNVGHVPAFQRIITKARSRRIGLVLALQSFAQLNDVYGPAIQQIIIDSCKTKILLKGAGEAERRAFSKVLGTRGALSYAITDNARGRSVHRREVQQPLMDEEQLFNMDEGQAVVITGRVRAFVSYLPKVNEDGRTKKWAHLPPEP